MDSNVPAMNAVQNTSTPLSAGPSTGSHQEGGQAGQGPSTPTGTGNPPPAQTPPPTPSQTTPTEAPQEPKKFSKKLLIIAVAAVILVIIVAALVFFLTGSNKKQSNIPTTVSDSFPYTVVNAKGEKNTEVIREMAAEISDYVLSQRQADGYYNYLAHYNEQCEEENGEDKCPFSGVNMFETTNAWTALALFSGSQILDDPQLLDEANKDLVKLQEYCAQDRTQCNWVLAQPAIIYQATENLELLEFLKLQGEILLTSPPSDDAMLTAIEARELALLYEITQDTRYIVAAQNRLNLASQKLNDQPDLYPETTQRFAQSSCWVSLANAEISKTTQNSQGDTNTQAFLQNGNIEENFKSFPSPIDIQPCVESYALSGNSSQTNTLTEKFIQNFYDGKERKLIYGKGGSVFQPYTDSRFVVLTDSAYTGFLLYKLMNQ